MDLSTWCNTCQMETFVNKEVNDWWACLATWFLNHILNTWNLVFRHQSDEKKEKCLQKGKRFLR
jgi:hypothetical protein